MSRFFLATLFILAMMGAGCAIQTPIVPQIQSSNSFKISNIEILSLDPSGNYRENERNIIVRLSEVAESIQVIVTPAIDDKQITAKLAVLQEKVTYVPTGKLNPRTRYRISVTAKLGDNVQTLDAYFTTANFAAAH